VYEDITEMDNQEIPLSEPTTLNQNVFVRTGYIFNGWNTEPDGSGTSFSDGEEIDASLLEGRKMTLYAQWDLVGGFDSNGATNARFSVRANKMVRFSRGNLQYQASTNTWRFAENQYDTIGADNTNISATNTGWIDLFGWGTGSNPTNTSTNNGDYSSFTDW
jgi:uncharacterized repeat protein (TIGR02543 family)